MVDLLETENRPWGSFKVLARGEDYVVKELRVSPFCQTSYQSHEGRQELWLPISGTGTAVINDNDIPLVGGINLPVMVHFNNKHRIRNDHESEDLVIVEIWSGHDMREDDIRRYEDDYGRM